MILKSIRLKNFLAYGEAFVDLGGIHLGVVTGPNGNGKSALFDALTYALCGKARTRVDRDLIRIGQSDMKVEVELQDGDRRYRVGRGTNKSGKSVMTFDELVDGHWRTCAGTGIRETEAKVQQLIGLDYQTLVYSCLVLQGDSARFSSADPSDRKQVLTSILNLGVYEQAAKLTRERGRETVAEVKADQGLIERHEVELAHKPEAAESLVSAEKVSLAAGNAVTRLEEQIKDLQERQRELAGSSARLESIGKQEMEIAAEILRLQNEIASLRTQKASLDAELARADEIRRGADRHKAATEELRVIDEIGRQVNSLGLQKAEAQSRADTLTRERGQKVADAERAYSDLLHSTGMKVDNLKDEMARLKAQVDPLADLPCAGSDIQSSCALLANALTAKSRLPECEQELAAAQGEADAAPRSDTARALVQARREQDEPNPHIADTQRLDAEIRALNFDVEKQASLLREVGELSDYTNRLTQLSVAEASLNGVERSIAEKESAKEAAAEKLSGIKAQAQALLPAAEEIAEVALKLLEVESSLAVQRRAAQVAQEDMARAKARVESLNKLEGEVEEIKARIAERQAEVETSARVAEMLGRNGVQTLLIERAIPALEADACSILERIAPGVSISIPSQRANQDGSVAEKLDIIVTDVDGTRPYENYSGGERFRIDFALRIALTKLLTRRAGAKLELLVIDEGFGSQDAQGLARMLDCLAAIQDQFAQVFVVSHIDAMTEAFPCRIEVRKEPGGSTIRMVA